MIDMFVIIGALPETDIIDDQIKITLHRLSDRLEEGSFGFVDSFGGRLKGTRKLSCEMTLRDGRIVYDLNGLARPDWKTLPRGYRTTGDPRWDGDKR